MAQARKAYLRQLLDDSKTIPEAARKAGVARSSLYKLLESNDIEVPRHMPKPHGFGRSYMRDEVVARAGSFRL